LHFVVFKGILLPTVLSVQRFPRFICGLGKCFPGPVEVTESDRGVHGPRNFEVICVAGLIKEDESKGA
jgi:hypothetical protein